MNIHHIGHSSLQTPVQSLQLNNVLHIPQVTRNLLSIHRLANDNNISLSFIRPIFLLRIDSRRDFFYKASVKEGSIQSNQDALPCQRRLFSLQNLLKDNGIADLAILLHPLFNKFFIQIIFHMFQIPQIIMSIMLFSKLRVISYLLPLPIILLLLLLNLCSLMYRA